MPPFIAMTKYLSFYEAMNIETWKKIGRFPMTCGKERAGASSEDNIGTNVGKGY